jgi:Lrp/AsnC family transcriptional regulator for asnA, asnC and gidA
MKYQPDEIDWKIIDILREGHIPNNAIAKQLGVSEGMIRQRIKRLKESDILTIKALINPDVLENQQLSLVAINVKEHALLEDKAKEIAKLSNVLSVSVASGRYDMIVEVLVSSNRGLVQFLTDVLSKVSGIASTESFMMLKTYKKFV